MSDPKVPQDVVFTVGPASDAKGADPITDAANEMLDGMDPNRRRAIEAEARRLRARLLSIPWYAAKEARRGARCWIMMALSYGGED